MSQKSYRFMNVQHLGPLLSVMLLAPLAMAPKGCSAGTVGDDCPATMPCGDAGSTSMGNGGSNAMGTAGSMGVAGSTAIGGSTSMGSGGSTSMGSGGSTGAACGGMLATKCSASDYCDFVPSAQCGAADQTGTCQPRPQACDDIYAPVCGCDNKTYPSDCVAAAAGVSVLSMGTCSGNMGSGGSTGTGGGSGTTCGGLVATTCGMGEFCQLSPGNCMVADATGTCTPIPQGCTDIYSPVCGCDGKTYPSDCAAAAAGVSVNSMGTCGGNTGTGGSSGSGGSGGAGGGATCGSFTGVTCAMGEYCYYPLMAMCGAADAPGTCTKLPGACDAIVSPVCGCDGKTYSNDCAAAAAGVSVQSESACK